MLRILQPPYGESGNTSSSPESGPVSRNSPGTMPERMYHFLLIEDVESDALLIEMELRHAKIQFTLTCVETEEEFLSALRRGPVDAILSDYFLPGFSAMKALTLMQQIGMDIPFILVTGSQSEEIAVNCIKQGADDYLLKQSLARLPSAVINAIEKKRVEHERKKAILDLKSSRENLRALTAHLQSVREEERTRIAREIHDELGQALTALKMDIQWLHGKITSVTPSPVKEFDETVLSMTTLIDSTINAVRRIATDLRPGVLDDLGLIPAIEWQAQEFASRTGIITRFISQEHDVEIDRESSTAIFRILQESLTNVVRHAGATQVTIGFDVGADSIAMVITDNGKGINTAELVSPNSLGLLGMKERAALLGGEIGIHGSPGNGTTVRVLFPRVRQPE